LRHVYALFIPKLPPLNGKITQMSKFVFGLKQMFSDFGSYAAFLLSLTVNMRTTNQIKNLGSLVNVS
jgi:hypothetical protein